MEVMMSARYVYKALRLTGEDTARHYVIDTDVKNVLEKPNAWEFDSFADAIAFITDKVVVQLNGEFYAKT